MFTKVGSNQISYINITYTDYAPNSYKIMSRSPGKYEGKAVCSFYGDIADVKSNAILIDHLYPNYDDILKNQAVIDGMNASWQSTLNAADAAGI